MKRLGPVAMILTFTLAAAHQYMNSNWTEDVELDGILIVIAVGVVEILVAFCTDRLLLDYNLLLWHLDISLQTLIFKGLAFSETSKTDARACEYWLETITACFCILVIDPCGLPSTYTLRMCRWSSHCAEGIMTGLKRLCYQFSSPGRLGVFCLCSYRLEHAGLWWQVIWISDVE